MRDELYELKAQSDATTFEFTSVGPKGEIPKLVVYSKTGVKNLYNLAFGDKDPNTGDFDDLAVTNNGDSQKVLATVASTIYAFTYKYPNALVIVKGSTKARTRLYQMGISKNLEDITTHFMVFGEKDGIVYPFERNIGYDAFLITRKKN